MEWMIVQLHDSRHMLKTVIIQKVMVFCARMFLHKKIIRFFFMQKNIGLGVRTNPTIVYFKIALLHFKIDHSFNYAPRKLTHAQLFKRELTHIRHF